MSGAISRSTRAGAASAALAAVLGLFPTLPAAAAEEDSRIESLEQRVRELERDLAELRRSGTVDLARLDEVERQIRILTQEIENLKLGEAAPEARGGRYGLGPAASKVYAVERGVSVGGYGEALYENFDSRREDGAASGKRDELDFLRAVLYFGYKFNDRIVFNSELEFEHASTGRAGEVSVEFGYLDFLLREALNVRAGMVLVPMGHINELHEPPIFLGARRPFVEQTLIPTTWRENGVGLFGEAGLVSYRAYVVNGLAATAGTSSKASGFGASGIRGGRSGGSRAAAEDLAVTGRLDVRPVEGLLLGGAVYTGDAGQGRISTTTGERIEARTTLYDAHAELRWRGLEARALFVRTIIEDAAAINEAQGIVPCSATPGPGQKPCSESVGQRQYGWYGQVGYNVLAHREGTRQALIPYVRYERYDTQDRTPRGFASNPANDVTVTTVGVAWKPIVNVAVKADFNRIENEARTGVDQLSLALGFLF